MKKSVGVSRARKGGTWDVCDQGSRESLKDYKTLKKYMRINYGGSGITLKFRGLNKLEMSTIERIVEYG
jgi:hypothetical protein